jgi:CubicO group peptidase (beta-lactamase class C family)
VSGGRAGPEDIGWSLAVAHRGHVVHTECTGPRTPATRFDLASTSKQFTALAAILTLDLDEDDWRLIRHQSGLPDYIDLMIEGGASYRRRTTTDDAIAALRGARNEFRPGTAWGYSNTNYLLLGIHVAKSNGKPLPDVLADHVFQPLGLDLVMDPLGRVPDRATSFDEEGRPADSIWEQVGDGAVWGSPSELARWGDAWSAAPFGEDVLAKQLDAVEAEDGDRYGAGIFVTADGRLHHDGDWGGFRSRFAVDPGARVTVAMCANQPGHLPDDHGLGLLAEWVERLGSS